VKRAKTVMFVGTGSDVGKSVLAAALCRVLKQDGFRVAPFKAQNMALNSFVTADGGEMGRAQVMQAEAAGVEPHVDMNPILLKPTSNKGSQVIVLGKPVGNFEAVSYYRYKHQLLPVVLDAFDRLSRTYDVVVMEGAGSAVELNLKEHDLVNLAMARRTNTPCVLVGDIDRGGIFAALVGSIMLMEPEERELIKGLIVNKFRGDPALFESGTKLLEKLSGRPVLGLVPYFDDIILPEEDSVALARRVCKGLALESINIGVVRLPHISNYTDFDAFSRDSRVEVHYFASPELIFNFDSVVIPGSKNTIEDLLFLHESGLADAIRAFWKSGRMVVGICGGYQMLGVEVKDPWGCESRRTEIKGLEILPMITEMHADKITRQAKAEIRKDHHFWNYWAGFIGVPEGSIEGYEIHMGRSLELPGSGENLSGIFRITERRGEKMPIPVEDGMASARGLAWGTYLHGIFDNDLFRKWFVAAVASTVGKSIDVKNEVSGYWIWKDEQYNLLAEHFRKHVSVEKLYRIIGL